MKKILLAIGFFVTLNTEAQVVNKFRDSSVFFKGVRFDSTLVFKGLKAGSTADTNVVVISSTGKASKVSKSAFLGDLPIYSISDSNTVINYDVLNSQNTPPVSPSTGDVYLVGTSPSGAWVGHPKDIAEWNGSAWVFTDGVQGDFLYNATNALTYIFRSGNWVQTTGIPALNNGNTISSGLRIGTNNARSLTFETNNVNRGRFDSIGRFHIYNLPTSSTSDTFVTKSDLSGKLTKVGQSTFLSGVNTDAQTLSLTRDTLSISNGNSLKLPSTIFQNGVKIIEDTTYTLSNEDAGYYLVAINPNTHFIMPTPCPFSVGDVIGLSGDLDTTTFDLSSTVTDIQMFTGQLSETGETFIMQCVDVGGGAEMLPLSAIIDDNGTLKTLNKYLYDNQAFTKLTDSLSTKTNKLISFSSYTTSDTLRLTDADKVIEMNVGSANNLVIPTNTAYAFPVGTQIVLIQIGAGQTTLVPASGVTVRSSSSKLKLTGQYSGATLIKKNTNEWYLFGDITN